MLRKIKINQGYQPLIGRYPRGKKLIEDIPKKLNWEVLVLIDILEIALPCFLKEKATIKEVPIEYKRLLKGKLPTAKVYPVKEYNKDLLLVKAFKEEELEKAIAKALEEKYIEDQQQLEKEPFTIEVYLVKVYKALVEIKPQESKQLESFS